MKVSEAIRRKRAIRDFTDEPLPDEVVTAILKAGRRAQSSKNRQAWRFLAIRERETLRQVSKLGQFAGHLAGAALGVLILTPPPDKFYGALFDAGQAAAYMQLTATELGVGSCLATLYDSDKVAALLNIPDDWQALMAISFGYPAEKEKLRLAKLLKGRKDFDELVKWEKWS